MEKVLSDIKPVITLEKNRKYNLSEEPSELSSHGYADYAGDDPSD